MMLGVLGILYFIGIKDQPGAFWGFFAMFLVLFFATGVGNASTFQMIPNIMRKEMDRLMPTADAVTRQRQAEKELAAITGFTSAIAAFGAFFIPKSYGTSIDLTGGVQGALWGFFIFYVICVVITWAVYTRKGGLLHDIERSRPHFVPSPKLPNKEANDESFSRQVVVLHAPQGGIRRRARRDDHRRPFLGGRLPEALAARQDRALHPWRELHGLVLVEGLRQGRHRHLGDAADRLSAHAAGPAQSRAARLRARRELQLVSLFRQPGEISAGALAAAEAVARGARADDAGGGLEVDRRGSRRSAPPMCRSAGSAASFARAGTRSTRSSAAANAYTAKTYGPDRVFGFSPIPAMSMVSYAAGARYLSLLGGVCMSFYDWYCDLPPASPQTWGEQTDVPESADWYNSGFLILWGSNVPQTRTPDAHFYTEVRYKGAKSVVICPDYSEASKFADLWVSPKQGTDAALGDGDGPRHPARNSTSTVRPSISTTMCASTPTCRCWCGW